MNQTKLAALRKKYAEKFKALEARGLELASGRPLTLPATGGAGGTIALARTDESDTTEKQTYTALMIDGSMMELAPGLLIQVSVEGIDLARTREVAQMPVLIDHNNARESRVGFVDTAKIKKAANEYGYLSLYGPVEFSPHSEMAARVQDEMAAGMDEQLSVGLSILDLEFNELDNDTLLISLVSTFVFELSIVAVGQCRHTRLEADTPPPEDSADDKKTDETMKADATVAEPPPHPEPEPEPARRPPEARHIREALGLARAQYGRKFAERNRPRANIVRAGKNTAGIR